MGATSKTHSFSGGRLVSAPTDLNSPETDCDGTQLGTVQMLRVHFTRRSDEIVAQEFGMSIQDLVLLDTEVLLTATFTGWDEDAVSRIFYGAATGSGTPLLFDTETDYGALAGETKASDLLWIPNDDANAPAVRAYRALPWGDPKVYFAARRPSVLQATWLCTRTSTGRKLRSDLLASGNL